VSDLESLNKLRWRCRRGTMELDLMLMRYLELCYAASEKIDKQSFVSLLEKEDTELLRYLLGEIIDYPSELAKIIHQIRSLTPVETV
jgi:antitoxin CptB